MLGDDVRTNIKKEFMEEGIKGTLMDCKSDKAPGIDDFDMRFLQEFCHLVKNDLMDVFEIIKLHVPGPTCKERKGGKY